MTPKPLQLKRHRAAAVPPPDEAPQAQVARPIVPTALHVLIPIAIGALWALAIDGIRLSDVTDLGLISAMPVSALVLLALLTVSFCLALRGPQVQPWVAFVHVVVLIAILYGVSVFIDPEARTSSVYRHVGIIDHIIRHGGVDASIDAYFNWPGFFALGAMISQAAGLDGPLELAPWAPLVFNLLYLPPLLVIFRWASDDPRVWWLGLWVFFSANWVGQDYLAPQTLAFTLWLAILAVLLTWFTPRPAALGSSLRRIRARVRDERDALGRRLPPRRATGLVLTVVVIFAAIVTGHQLTPFAIVLGVSALVVFAGLQTRRLPIIMAVLLAAWISYQTTSYLSGHLETLTGPLGSTSENLSKNVAGRFAGSSDHALIVNVRVAGSALIWLLALAGLARRLRARRLDLAFVVLGAPPFLLPIIQPYGGEMLLRVFLFTLPVVAFFIASLAFPTPRHGRGWPTIAAVALVICVLLGLFQFMRYGNERLDHFTPGDHATVDALYRAAKPGTTLFGSSNLPWKFRDYAGYDYRSITALRAWRSTARPTPAAVGAEIARVAPAAGAYVVVTRSMKVHAELLIGKPGVLEGLVTLLRGSPIAKRIYHGVDGDVFHVAHAATFPALRQSQPSGTPPAVRRPAPAVRPPSLLPAPSPLLFPPPAPPAPPPAPPKIGPRVPFYDLG